MYSAATVTALNPTADRLVLCTDLTKLASWIIPQVVSAKTDRVMRLRSVVS